MTATTAIIQVVIIILGLGVISQVLADRLRIPSVIFLILSGIIVGPEGLGFITPAIFGEALPAIVGLSVAIIVFEGAFHLHIEHIREAHIETLRLVTVGAIISLIGTAIVVRFAIGASWNIAFLIGSLIIATGPTVITPIMNVVPVRERVSSTLETEGVVNDVTAAILSIVMFEYLLLEARGLTTIVREFATRFGVGIIVGVSVAAIVGFILRYIDLSAENTPQNARLIVLVSSLVCYGIAEVLISEAGIAAAATGGFIIGNINIPYKEEIEQFKGDVSLLVISFIFITLASLLSFSDLTALGIGGIITVILVMLVIRPLLVFVSTIGDKLNIREKLFISLIGPRGIIPASVATLFALELQPQNSQAATILAGTVFLIIFTTVIFEGGLARHIAQKLNVIPMRAIIIGGGRVGKSLAERLDDRGEEVIIIEDKDEEIENLKTQGFTVVEGDGTKEKILEKAGIENAKIVALATGTDDVNLLIGQLAKTAYSVDTVVARVNEPSNIDAFEDLDIKAISGSKSIAVSMDNTIERPGIARWMTEIDRDGDVQEIEVTSESIIGETVSELQEGLPDNCHLALISREKDNKLPHQNDTIKKGDHLTLIGRKEAVREGIEYCSK